ncbi:hypothetical protein HAX54_043368, partial [Datura stramonium]|nr:hypothetical protein [Datura stramonium]
FINMSYSSSSLHTGSTFGDRVGFVGGGSGQGQQGLVRGVLCQPHSMLMAYVRRREILLTPGAINEVLCLPNSPENELKA